MTECCDCGCDDGEIRVGSLLLICPFCDKFMGSLIVKANKRTWQEKINNVQKFLEEQDVKPMCDNCGATKFHIIPDQVKRDISLKELDKDK